MANETGLESTSLTERLVLLSLLECGGDGEGAVQAHELCRTCRTLAERAEEPIVGKVSEADVIRTLYSLEADDVVAEFEPEGTSPVGKGRPGYELDVPEDVVLEAAGETPALEGIVESDFDR